MILLEVQLQRCARCRARLPSRSRWTDGHKRRNQHGQRVLCMAATALGLELEGSSRLSRAPGSRLGSRNMVLIDSGYASTWQ